MKSLLILTIMISSLIAGIFFCQPMLAFAISTPDPTSVTITTSSSTVNAGESITLVISVADTLHPTNSTSGTVTLSDGNGGGTFSQASCTLSAQACTVSYTGAINPITVTITASYSGDSTHSTSSGTIPITVIKHPSSTLVQANQTTVNPAGSVTLVTKVSDTSTVSITPTGTISFSDNGAGGTFNATSCTVSASGCTVLYRLGPSTPSTLNIVASYGGDTSHSASSGSASLTVNVHSSSVAISPSTATVNAGGAITFNATVSDPSSSPIIPSGSVTFSDSNAGGTFSPSSCTLSSGNCLVVYTLSTSAPSAVTITGTYSGDSGHSTSTSTSSLTVHPLRTTSTTVTPSSATLNSITPFAISVRVADPLNSTNVPTGVVSLTDSNAGGTFSPTSCTLSSGNCTSSYTPSSSLQSTVTITATYLGDSTHATSFGTSQLSINILHTTAVIINPNQTAFVLGGIIQFNATVRDTSNSQTSPSGTITWDDTHGGGSFIPDSCTLSTTVCMTTYTSAINAPSHVTVTATYSGDTTHATSTGAASLNAGVGASSAGTSTPSSTSSSNSVSSSSPSITTSSGQSIQSTNSISIPSWVRNNAELWHDNKIADSDFEGGIQYMIQQGIMKIPSTQPGNSTVKEVPTWVKNNAGWWAQGTISDDDFVKGIQYLITNGIIKV